MMASLTHSTVGRVWSDQAPCILLVWFKRPANDGWIEVWVVYFAKDASTYTNCHPPDYEGT